MISNELERFGAEVVPAVIGSQNWNTTLFPSIETDDIYGEIQARSEKYVYVTLIDRGEEGMETYFAPGPSHEIIEEALRQRNPNLRDTPMVRAQLHHFNDLYGLIFTSPLADQEAEVKAVKAILPKLPPQIVASFFGLRVTSWQREFPTITYDSRGLTVPEMKPAGRRPIS